MTRGAGRQTSHSFSFGEFYDPERVSFGPMIALNDELLAAGAGYDDHEHSDVVLVTWVVSGALRHTDASGTSVLRPGQIAVARAGTRITHAEHAEGVVTRFIQAWLRPDRPGGVPLREVGAPDLVTGRLVTVAGADALELGIAGARLDVAALGDGHSVVLPDAPLVHVFVASGALTRSSLAEPLSAGDAFEITGESGLTVTPAVPTLLLVWSFTGP